MNTGSVTVLGEVDLTYRGDIVSTFSGAKLLTQTWLWTGGVLKTESDGTLRMAVQDVARWIGGSTRYVRNGPVEIEAAQIEADYTSYIDMDSNARMVLVNGTHLTCQHHCDFDSGTLVVEKDATITIEDDELTAQSSRFGCNFEVNGALRSVGRVNIDGRTDVYGELTLSGGATLEVSRYAKLTLAADAVIDVDDIFLSSYSATVQINSRQMSLRELRCVSSSTIVFGENAGLTGLKSIYNPTGSCDITLPPGDLSLDSASIGGSLRLGSRSSTLHAKEMTLQGSIIGPGSVRVDSLSWLSSGFNNVNATLGATSIFASSVSVSNGAFVVLTQGATVRSTSTQMSFNLGGGSTVHVELATEIDVRSDMTIGGGSNDVLLNEGAIVFGRADSNNHINCRFRNPGSFRLASAASVEMHQLEIEGAGRVKLESPTSRIRFTDRKSTISKDGLLEGGELEVYNGELQAPADRIKVENLNVMSSGKLTALSGRGAGITMAKTIKLTGGDLELGAQVVVPTLIMSSSSSEINVQPTGHLLVAINFAWQQGSLRAAEGQAAVKVDGEMVMSSSTYKYMYGLALQVQGRAAWTQGRVYVNDGSNIHILRGGSFEMMSTANMYTNARGFFLVDGMLNVTVCGTEAPLSAPLNVTGVVNVRGGLNLLAGGSMSEAAKVSLLSDGSVFKLGSGMFIAETLSGISGSLGSMEVTGGHLVARSGSLPILLSTSGGQIEAAEGTVTLAGGLSWNNGDVRLSDGLFRVKRASVWAGGTLRGALSWDGTVTVAGTTTKYVYGAMTVGSNGVMRHVQGDICVSCSGSSGNFVVRHGGLLVGEPQGNTHLNALTGRFINLGTVSVVSVAEPYRISGLANHGRLIALRGEARLGGTTEFGPSADVKGTANVTIAGSLIVGGRVNLRSPGMLVCDGCNLYVRSAAWLGGNTWARNFDIHFDSGHCPEVDQFAGDDLLRPPCPEAVLTLQGNFEAHCDSCDFTDGVRLANEGVFTAYGSNLEMSGVFENRGVARFRDLQLYEDYRTEVSFVNEADAVLIFEAPERGSTAETLVIRGPVVNNGGVVRVEGSQRAYIECVSQTSGSLVVDAAGGLRTSSCGVKVMGGELTGYGRVLQSVECDGCQLSPGPGRLTVDGDMSVTDATLTTVLRTAMKSDELYVGGSLTLSGTVHHAMPVASSYMTLGLADTRVVPVTYASVAGDFTSFATAGEFSANRTLAETRYVVVLEV